MRRLSVWCVAGGWDYEGEHVESLRLFRSEESARRYEAELLGPDHHYDYVERVERVVE